MPALVNHETLNGVPLTFRRMAKMEQIARLEIAGKKDPEIAALFSLSAAGLAVLKRRPEYQELRKHLLDEHLKTADKELASRLDLQMRREAVPAALTAMIATVKQSRDLRMQLEAAKEILDREPSRQFAKERGSNGSGNNNPPPAAIFDLTIQNSNAVAATSQAASQVVVQPPAPAYSPANVVPLATELQTIEG